MASRASLLLLSVALMPLLAAAKSRLPPNADKTPIFITTADRRFSANRSTSLCPCSASSNGHPPLSDPDAVALIDLMRRFSFVSFKSLRTPSFQRKLQQLTEKLVKRYGAEGYTNLDTKLRGIINRTHCVYDKQSGRNLREYSRNRKTGVVTLVSLRGCDTFEQFAASKAQMANFVPSPGPSPPTSATTPGPKAGPGSGGVSDGPGVTTAPDVSPDLGPTSSPEVESSTAIPPMSESPSSPPRTSTASTSSSPSVSPSVSPSASPANEGCVAAEHLVGHSVQHRAHLRRAVLCSRGFCATPNHAIIVDGVWTSMKRLCASEWTCTQDMRLVNNLKISEMTRLRFDDRIVITPYDIRFPVAFPWIVQIAEDMIAMILTALKAAFLGVVAVCIYGVTSVTQNAKTEANAVNLFEDARVVRKTCAAGTQQRGSLPVGEARPTVRC